MNNLYTSFYISIPQLKISVMYPPLHHQGTFSLPTSSLSISTTSFPFHYPYLLSSPVHLLYPGPLLPFPPPPFPPSPSFPCLLPSLSPTLTVHIVTSECNRQYLKKKNPSPPPFLSSLHLSFSCFPSFFAFSFKPELLLFTPFLK